MKTNDTKTIEKHVKQYRDAGYSYAKIARELTKQGFTTVRGYRLSAHYLYNVYYRSTRTNTTIVKQDITGADEVSYIMAGNFSKQTKVKLLSALLE